MIEEKYKSLATYVESGIEGIRRTGLKVLALQDRYVKLLMPLQGNVNHVGIMYAGSLFTIGEPSSVPPSIWVNTTLLSGRFKSASGGPS